MTIFVNNFKTIVSLVRLFHIFYFLSSRPFTWRKFWDNLKNNKNLSAIDFSPAAAEVLQDRDRPRRPSSSNQYGNGKRSLTLW